MSAGGPQSRHRGPFSGYAVRLALAAPEPSPREFRRSPPDPSQMVRRAFIFLLFSTIFLQRFALPVGQDGTPLNLIITLGVTGLLLMLGRLNIDPVRCALVLVFAAYSLMSATLNGDHSSWSSAALVIAMYLPFAFIMQPVEGLLEDCLRAFQTMVLVCSICGIAQFLIQFGTHSKLLYTFHGFLPPGILLNGFANLLPISYGSPLNRSNGFFLVEPSTFSQFVALAIIVELMFFQVKWRLVVYGASLLFAYSGTGLVALILIPAILVKRRSFGTIAALIVFGALVMATSELLHLNVIGQRANEFGSNESSAHARYFAPADLIAQYLLPNPQGLLFGVGPGTLRNYIMLMPFETHDPAWAKLLFEYGLIGSILFWTLYILAVFVHSPSAWMSVALTIGFLSFGGELLDPRLNALLLVFCVFPKPVAFASATLRRALPTVAHAT
jgi:hypothetical protein